MEKKYIIYFGIIFMPYKNAMCQRAISMASIIKKNGYEPVIIGMRKNIEDDLEREYQGFKYETVEYPHSKIEMLISMVNCKDILSKISEIDANDIKAIIVADYRLIPMIKIKNYCKKNNIQYIIDVMDWFVPKTNNVLDDILKRIDNRLRVSLLYKKVNNVICICETIYEKYKGENKKVTVIPGTSIKEKNIYLRNEKKISGEILKIIFAGNPGTKCEKEKIDWLIKAIYILKNEGVDNIEAYFVGFDKEEFFINNPKLKQYVLPSMYFLGRVEHKKCIDLIRNSDISVVLRENNISSNFAFSTKIGEAFACGTPVFATDTSDNKKYIKNGFNGYVCGANYNSVYNTLKMLASLSQNKKRQLCRNAFYSNPLVDELYVEKLNEVL